MCVVSSCIFATFSSEPRIMRASHGRRVCRSSHTMMRLRRLMAMGR